MARSTLARVDCFDVLASANNPSIHSPALENRQFLRAAMARFAFKAFSQEWWHFQLADEPFRSENFDFPIRPRH
jgi:D-alanyl-D-alanine dipeptidase